MSGWRCGPEASRWTFRGRERRIFKVEDVEVPVARLEHIVRSKAAVGRPKDQLFLATHEDALKQRFPNLNKDPNAE